ncbi:MAG: choice-of-anchor D domain-containing protein, partial [bacterium]
MKRNSLLGISLLLFPVLAWAQGKITRHGLQIDRQQRPVAITGEERPGEIARTVKPHSGNRTGAVGPGVLLMESHYDYGSNGGVLTNLWDYGDGTLAVARMAATQGPAPTSPDRGTFFSYFDGFTWTPMSKVEQSRRGWSNISSVIDGRSVVSSHTIGSVLEVNVDALKGLGIWTSAITGFTTNLNTGWPRLTVDGRDNIIVCSSIDGLVDSLQGLKEIAISRDQGSTWSLQVLFPEISTRTPIFRVDDQAIDSFGDKVAVAVAELGGDIHLWESLDNGATWQYRNVTNYPLDVQPGAEELRPYIACDVIYDNDGDLHIFWETVLATQDAPGTELELFFSRNAGIQHWSENTAQVQTVAWADLSGAELESDQQLFVAGSPFNQVNATMSLVGQPQAGVDANGSLFLLFAALRPLDFDVADSTHFTDVFAVRSDDDGAAWGVPVNVTDTPQSEDLWASLADNVGDSLRFVYQSDDNTGNELQGGGVAPTRLLYYAFPTNALPSGNLEGPHLFVSPRQLNFGRGFIGDTSAARVIALRSTGTEPVTISSILLAGADFKLLNVPATPMVLLPDSSIIFQAAFAPTVSGILTGSLTITSDDADEPNQAVTLQGLGFLPPPLGTALYVVNEFTGNINQIDPLSGTILNNIPVPVQTFNGVSGLAFDGVSLFYTPGFGFNQIYELDPETGQVRNSFVTPQGVPVDALAHSGSSLFATAFGSTTIYELDPSTGQILNTITAPFFLRGGMTYGGKRQSLFAQTEFGQVVELDPFNGEILHSFPAAPGEFYTGLGYSNGLGVLFAGSSFSGNVFALDPDNGGILATFPIFDLFFASLSGLAADESLVLSGPHLLARPESISFGKVGLGKPSAAQRITLRNIGTENVIVSGVSRADASFQLLDLPDFPLTLAPATFASFLVAYSPEQPVAANDTLKISSNDVDGPVQFVSLSGFGVRPPRPGTLFASTGRIDSLLTIDPATGQSAVVGSTAGFGGITEIEFREDGVLFGATDQGQIVRLDPITGAPTLVASPFGQITGMEFDAIGRLFGTFTNFSGDISQLVTIDPITGFFTFIGSTGFRNVGGLAFAPDGTLLGVTGGFFEGGDLIRINIST